MKRYLIAFLIITALVLTLPSTANNFSYKKIFISWDSVVKGNYVYRVNIKWRGSGITRELVATYGYSHFYGSIDFKKPVNLTDSEAIVVSLNSTALYVYTSMGGRASMKEEYLNGEQHSSVGLSFDVKSINFKSKAELRLVSYTTKGCTLSEITYLTSTMGEGELSIGSIWYWRHPDPSLLFYRKETASGTFDIYSAIIFKSPSLVFKNELAPVHPISP